LAAFSTDLRDVKSHSMKVILHFVVDSTSDIKLASLLVFLPVK